MKIALIQFILEESKINPKNQCPKGISLENIARMNREFLSASLK